MKKNPLLALFHPASNTVLAHQLAMADHFFSRFAGLMLRRHLSHNSGLLIKPCQQIHTHFMRFAIDVIFVNQDHRVLHIEREMQPWRISKFYKQAAYVVELNAGITKNVGIGELIQIVPQQGGIE